MFRLSSLLSRDIAITMRLSRFSRDLPHPCLRWDRLAHPLPCRWSKEDPMMATWDLTLPQRRWLARQNDRISFQKCPDAPWFYQMTPMPHAPCHGTAPLAARSFTHINTNDSPPITSSPLELRDPSPPIARLPSPSTVWETGSAALRSVLWARLVREVRAGPQHRVFALRHEYVSVGHRRKYSVVPQPRVDNLPPQIPIKLNMTGRSHLLNSLIGT
jgi:hypothetical protein